MACSMIIYDFVSGARIRMPGFPRNAMAAENGGRGGIGSVLKPDEAARTLLSEHLKVLSELKRPAAG